MYSSLNQLVADPRNNETVKRVARHICEHPGQSGKLIATALDISFDHFRHIVRMLKRWGFENYRNGSGYLPPAGW